MEYELIYEFFQKHFILHEHSATKNSFNTYVCYDPDGLFWLNLYVILLGLQYFMRVHWGHYIKFPSIYEMKNWGFLPKIQFFRWPHYTTLHSGFIIKVKRKFAVTFIKLINFVEPSSINLKRTQHCQGISKQVPEIQLINLAGMSSGHKSWT